MEEERERRWRETESIADKYYPALLGWARRQVGVLADAEDLAQEAMAQILIAAGRAARIEDMDRFAWRIAHYVFCNYIRRKGRASFCAISENIPQDGDFAADVDEELDRQALMRRTRRRLADLARVQREAMVLRYIDGLPVAEVAARLGLSESAVSWQLHDARQRVREDLSDMQMTNEPRAYRPGRMSIGLSGNPGDDPDTARVRGSLIRQNICLLCYREGKTMEQLAEATGVPVSYLEFDVDWLLRREFIAKVGRRYQTAFPIISRGHYQAVGGLFLEARGELSDTVIAHLNSREREIRALGFYGSDFEWGRLMWALIMLFTSYVSRNCPALTSRKERDEREIRPDGGRYYIVASDFSDGQPPDPNGYRWPSGWDGYYGICSGARLPDTSVDAYYWLGVYNFADESAHPRIIDGRDGRAQAALRDLYLALPEADFSPDALDEYAKASLAEEIAGGFVSEDLKPRFVIIQRERLARLQSDVFAPLLERVAPVFDKLAARIEALHVAAIPKANRGYVDYYTYLDLWDFGIYTLVFAAEGGQLYMPDSPRDGAPLTLVVVR